MVKNIITLTVIINLFSIIGYSQIHKLFNHDPDALYTFGDAVSISGDLALINRMGKIGVMLHKCYVYKKTYKNWQEIQDLNFSHIAYGISINNKRFVIRKSYPSVGSDTADYLIIYSFGNDEKFSISDTIYGPNESIKGPTIYKDWLLYRDQDEIDSDTYMNTYIFYQYENGKWIRKQEFKSKVHGTFNSESYRFSIRGNYAVIGEPDDSNDTGENNGKVIVFKLVEGNWKKFQTIKQPDPYTSDSWFGINVSVSPDNNFIAIIARRDYISVNGPIYIYRYSSDNNRFNLFQKLLK